MAVSAITFIPASASNMAADEDLTVGNLGELYSSGDIGISYLQRLSYAESGAALPVGSSTNAIHGGHHTRVLRTENGTYAVIITRTVERDNKMVEDIYEEGYNELNDPFGDHIIIHDQPIDLIEKYKDDPEGHPYWIRGINYYSVVKITPTGVKTILEDICPDNASSHVPEIYAGENGHIYVIYPGEDPDTYYTKWRAMTDGLIPSSEFKNAAYLTIHEIDTKTDTEVNPGGDTTVISFDTCAFDDHGYGKPSALVDLEARKIYCIYDGGYSKPAYIAWFIYDMDTGEWDPNCHTLSVEFRKDYYNLYPDGKGGAIFFNQRCIYAEAAMDALGFSLIGSQFAWDAVYYYHIKDMEEVTFSGDWELDRQLYDFVEIPVVAPEYNTDRTSNAPNSAGHYGDDGCSYMDTDGMLHLIATEGHGKTAKVKGSTTYHIIIDPTTDAEVFRQAIPTTLLPNNGASSGYNAGKGFTMTQDASGKYYIFHFTITSGKVKMEIFTSPAGDGRNFTRAVSSQFLTTSDGTRVSPGYPIIGNSRDGSIKDNVIPMVFNSTYDNNKVCYYYFSVQIGDEPVAHVHEWDDGAVTTAPTATDDGVMTYTCKGCGQTYTDTIPATGGGTDPHVHDYAAVVTAPTCTEQGYTTYTCAGCGDSYVSDYTDALGHAWNEGIVTTAPTLDSVGVKTFTCSRCHETYTEEVPKLTHIPGDITGEGQVGVSDIVRLLKYIAGDDVEVNQAALDVNGDGVVNVKDIIRLMKYLAGDPVEIF